jgi:release factor H-coupled RctB family protein
MGNPLKADGAAAPIRLIASTRAWIEGAAIQQLEHLARRPHVLAVAGMPDLHPGHHGPVGCAALVEGHVYPEIIGTDIGCGMQLHFLDLPERRLKLDKAVERMAALEGPWDGEAAALLEEAGVEAGVHAASLGTVGGGNHFCELQGVLELADAVAAARIGLEKGSLALLVHSGSRGLGAATLAAHARDGECLPLAGAGADYLADHDRAVRFARLNRAVIARRALAALRADGQEVLDSPHNLAERRGTAVLHRKGAAPADRGLVPVPGSRGAVTYLVEPLAGGEDTLASLAHGAGRKHDRGSMERRVRTKASDLDRLARNPFGGHVICTDRRLLVEEAPEAYKDIDRVVAEMADAGLCRVVAVLRPLITFKTARQPREDRR